MGELVETSLDEHGVALLRLNRPEARNALSPEAMELLASELERLDPDPEVRCIVIAGSEEVLGRAGERAAPLRAGDGDRGPGGGHAGLPREARAEVRGQVIPTDGPIPSK